MHRTFSIAALVAAVVSLGSVVGCGDTKTKDAKSTAKTIKDEHHAHPEEGPHGGHLIELGNENYHVEIVDDEKAHKVTAYVLDSTAQQAVPIDATEITINAVVAGKPTQYKLPAMPQSGETDGKSSRFELADEAMFEGVFEHKDSKARLLVSIDGKQYSGNIEHEDHQEHEHKKGDK